MVCAEGVIFQVDCEAVDVGEGFQDFQALCYDLGTDSISSYDGYVEFSNHLRPSFSHKEFLFLLQKFFALRFFGENTLAANWLSYFSRNIFRWRFFFSHKTSIHRNLLSPVRNQFSM